MGDDWLPSNLMNATSFDYPSAGRVSRRVSASAARVLAASLQPRLNAFVALREEASSTSAGLLAGTLYASKDIFATTDRRPRCGLAVEVPVSGGDCEALRRLDAAGADRIGYTALPELAYEPSGYNSVSGAVRNPWNLDFISGGSSAGSAAAVASGAAVFAVGSDTGGSLRIPAHACGVTAWKPTFGVVPTAGTMALAPTLDTVGLMAPSAADLANAARILTGPMPPAASVRRARLLADLIEVADPPIAAACHQAVEAIASTGVIIDRTDALTAIEKLDASLFALMEAEAARTHQALIGQGVLDGMLERRLRKGLSIDDQKLQQIVAARPRVTTEFLQQICGDADILVLPVMPIRTPELAQCDPRSDRFAAKTLYQLSRFTRFVNLLGLPAIVLPAGFDDRDMPVGLQIVGRPGADHTLIGQAQLMQSSTDWHARVPHAVSDLVGSQHVRES